MLLMIWVFDGLRTINKDKDVGSLMVGCMKLATMINVITTLLETGMGNYARYVASWSASWTEEKRDNLALYVFVKPMELSYGIVWRLLICLLVDRSTGCSLLMISSWWFPISGLSCFLRITM